jgi:hypothetical protein
MAEGARRGPWRMLSDQFTDFMIVVPLAAALVSRLIGKLIELVLRYRLGMGIATACSGSGQVR